MALSPKSAGGAWYATVNVHTGEAVGAAHRLPVPVEKLIELPTRLHDGRTEQRVFLAVSAAASGGFEGQLLPDSAAARAACAPLRASTFFWHVDSMARTLSGHVRKLWPLTNVDVQFWG